MGISVRNKKGDLVPLRIPAIRGENGKDGKNGIDGTNGQDGADGVTPNISIGTVTTLEAGEKATVVNSGTKEEPIFDFGIPRGEKGKDGTGGSGNGTGTSIDDTTISKEKTWSSSKIEDFVLTNVGAIWKDVTGGQVVIDSTMDGFLREVEILGNTVQNQEDLSDIQHLGVWNEEKQGYEVEICVSNTSNNNDLNYQEFRTTILLPCQLMKVGDISDRLYWDKDKGRYVVEKNVLIDNNIVETLKSNYKAISGDYYLIINNAWDTLDKGNYIKGRAITLVRNSNSPYTKAEDRSSHALYVRYGSGSALTDRGYENTRKGAVQAFEETVKGLIFQVATPQLIDTDIREELKLPTFINNTYISVSGGIQGAIKAKAPVDGGKVIGILQRENKELKATNEVQDELINTTMLATDEMYMMLEPLLAETLSERSVSKMVDMYVAMVQRGIKKIEDVPSRYREQVKEILAQLEK